ALIADVFPHDQLGRAMGTAQLSFGLMQLAGPPLGGIMYDHLGYYSVFILSAACVVLNIVVWALYIETPLAGPPTSEVVQLNAEAVGLSEEGRTASALGEKEHDTKAEQVAPETIGQVLSRWKVWVMLYMAFISGLCLTVYEPTLPLHLKSQFGYSSSQTGLVFLIWIVPNTVASPLVGWARDKWGSKWLLIGGAVMGLGSFPGVGAPLSIGGLAGMLVWL
ncbi:hypothetical protein HDU93_006989, partial [Gonapodya sp. JEL0774]